MKIYDDDDETNNLFLLCHYHNLGLKLYLAIKVNLKRSRYAL